MCRSIKTLREGVELGSSDDIEAAALQFVRKVSGFRRPAPANAEAFERAVKEIAHSTEHLLASLTIGGRPTAPTPS